jgi:hypothetical protein
MEKPPQNIPTPESEKTLTFEEFSHREPLLSEDPTVCLIKYNNFPMYFEDNSMISESLKKSDFYKRFTSEYPDLLLSLRDKIQNKLDKTKNTSERLKPFDKDLYEAYVIMRRYGATDGELFA